MPNARNKIKLSGIISSLILLLIISSTVSNCVHKPLVNPTEPVPCDPNTVYFERDILPILTSNCAVPGCHDAATATEDIILNNYTNVVTTTEIRLDDPKESEIYEVMTETDPDKRMPPPDSGLALTQAQIDLVLKWLEQGAKDLHCDDDEANCDTVGLTYNADIKDILRKHCVGCHSGNSPQAGVDLSTYNNVLTRVLDFTLIGVITHDTAFAPMPYLQPKLSDCKISKIKNWIADGAPEN